MVTLHASIDLATNLLARTFPYGIAVEVVRKSSLQQVLPDLNISDAEHVTRYFYKNAPQFRIHQMLSDAPELAQARLTIDTAEDLERFRQLARHLGRRVEEASYKEIATAYLDLFQDRCEQHSASLG
jgi:spore coat polysaccharide biosynthesis protein SpsF (cytidylyltransferase family)